MCKMCIKGRIKAEVDAENDASECEWMSHKLSKSEASKARGSNNTCNAHMCAFEVQGFPACHSYLQSSKWVVSHIISDQK